MTTSNYESQQASLALAIASALGISATTPAPGASDAGAAPPPAAALDATAAPPEPGAPVPSNPWVAALAVLLIDAMPYFQCVTAEMAHRSVLADTCVLALPGNGIASQPTQNTTGSRTTYTYNGPYDSYAQVFGPTMAALDAAQGMAARLQGFPQASGSWLGDYGVALAAHACGIQGMQNTNTNAIESALAGFNMQLLPMVTATYAQALLQAYPPTTAIFAIIASQGAQAGVGAQILQAILSGHFAAALDVVADEPDGQQAVDWFMYNLWTLLYALGQGVSAIDAQITIAAKSLPFSPEVGAGSWFNGGYTAWYTPMSGADVQSANFWIGLPQQQVTVFYPPFQYPEIIDIEAPACGYAQSFLQWSGLASQYQG